MTYFHNLPLIENHESGWLAGVVRFEITGEIIEWRGPAPFYFVATPPEVTDEIEIYKRELSYGWGVIPATVTLGTTTVTTSLIPRNGSFLVPIKDALRKPNGVQCGDDVSLLVELGR